MTVKHLSAKALAEQLIIENGLTSWTFQFDRAVRRFGSCRWREQIITLSAVLTELNAEIEVRNTILHEIAHALVGPKHWHDKVWKAKAIELGCTGNRCYSRSVVTPPHKFQAECHGCRKIYKANRRGRGSCANCSGGRFNPTYLLKWKRVS
jgi:predicted SprT family Zn-dependent metalloprotease